MNANTDGFGQASSLPKSPADLKHMCLDADGRRGGQPNEQQMGVMEVGVMEMGMMGREKAS